MEESGMVAQQFPIADDKMARITTVGVKVSGPRLTVVSLANTLSRRSAFWKWCFRFMPSGDSTRTYVERPCAPLEDVLGHSWLTQRLPNQPPVFNGWLQVCAPSIPLLCLVRR